MLKSRANEIEREIERAIDETIATKAARTTWRTMADDCTDKLRRLRDYIAQLELALADAILPPKLVLAT